jgi:hypothetical protein
MRRLMASVLAIAGIVSVAAVSTKAEQGRVAACSLLSREAIGKVVTPASKYILDAKPSEEPVGAKGSSCSYADLMLQVDPFARPDELRKAPGKDWQPVTGVGEAAYFHNNSDRFAELMGWSGAHHFTIQIGVPSDSTADKMKPGLIALANTILARLK